MDRLSASISRPPSAPGGSNLHDPAVSNSRVYQLARQTVLMSNEVAEYPPPDREGSRKRHGQLALRWEIRHVAVDEIGPARAGVTQDAASILSASTLIACHTPPAAAAFREGFGVPPGGPMSDAVPPNSRNQASGDGRVGRGLASPHRTASRYRWARTLRVRLRGPCTPLKVTVSCSSPIP